MKQRIYLAIAIILLWALLILFRIFAPYIPSVFLVIGFIAAYNVVLWVARLVVKVVKRKPCPANDGYHPFISIIIPAHNEQYVLENTIEALIDLDYPDYEILIMDDRSKDKTADVAKMMVERYPQRVRMHTRPNDAYPGKSAVLNDAMSIAKADIFCIFDADARVDKDFLKLMTPCLKPDKVAAVQARKVISNADTNFFTMCQNYEYYLDANVQRGRDSIKGAVELRGNGQIIKRSAVEAVGGWNNETITDDLDLSTRFMLKGFDIRFCADVLVREEGITEIKPLINQRKRWAEGSIRRYMDYAKELFFSKDISLRAALDTLAYFSPFILPIWLVSDFVIQCILILLASDTYLLAHLFANIAVLGFLGILCMGLFFLSIIKFEKHSPLNAVKWCIFTSLYLIVLWTIIVWVVMIKIIFTKRKLSWFKTDHFDNNDKKE